MWMVFTRRFMLVGTWVAFVFLSTTTCNEVANMDGPEFTVFFFCLWWIQVVECRCSCDFARLVGCIDEVLSWELFSTLSCFRAVLVGCCLLHCSFLVWWCFDGSCVVGLCGDWWNRATRQSTSAFWPSWIVLVFFRSFVLFFWGDLCWFSSAPSTWFWFPYMVLASGFVLCYVSCTITTLQISHRTSCLLV